MTDVFVIVFIAELDSKSLGLPELDSKPLQYPPLLMLPFLIVRPSLRFVCQHVPQRAEAGIDAIIDSLASRHFSILWPLGTSTEVSFSVFLDNLLSFLWLMACCRCDMPTYLNL